MVSRLVQLPPPLRIQQNQGYPILDVLFCKASSVWRVPTRDRMYDRCWILEWQRYHSQTLQHCDATPVNVFVGLSDKKNIPGHQKKHERIAFSGIDSELGRAQDLSTVLQLEVLWFLVFSDSGFLRRSPILIRSSFFGAAL